MNRDEIDQIKNAAGEYAKEALLARKAFIELRLKQDPEIRKVLIRAAKGITDTLRKSGSASVSGRLMAVVESKLNDLAERLRSDYTETIGGHIREAAKIGAQTNKAITIDLMHGKVQVPRVTKAGIDQLYFRVNEDAVRAIWDRTSHGLKLSDRIWNASKEARRVMTEIVQDAVATGQDAVQTARLLEQYVRPDANIPVKYYKGLLERTQGGIPDDLSYQALRVARTETTAALGQGTIKSAQVSPSAIGIQFCLSPSHQIQDICDELARHDEGLGSGVYPLDNPPPYPAHPNTLSFLVEKHRDSKDFVSDLKAWLNNPDSRPELESWYTDVYQNGAA
ncbi:retron-type reverse transcriptase [Cohnella silvisoli]|uniref:Retron-type reverse transcriptase n=1 Tax=Cohnella silvisoli TaxID=2873699 RepID=A0ABV1L322_9BACL|nr:retron-type reverse transcriptase [Cohnella silvisoli]MCD9025758.1 retron-type reverse transcriptase [Cohnella silvisoli]